MRMGQGVRTGLGHGGITCVLLTQFSSFSFIVWSGDQYCFRSSLRGMGEGSLEVSE